MENAGFTIIASETYYDDRVKFGFAIGEKDSRFSESGKEYVTWEYKEENGTRDYYWGHYYDDRDKAFVDYHTRLLAEYKDE